MRVREWQSGDYHNFWSSASRRYLDRVERIILKKFIQKGRVIIDVGGGYGRLLNLYHDRFAKVVVLDHSLSMLEDLQKRLAGLNVRNVILVAANVYSLPFHDNTFDQALMIRVLHHLDNPQSAIKSINRVIRPGGSLILEFQNLLNINNRIKRRFGKLNFNIDGNEPQQLEDMYWNFHPDYVHSCITPFFEVKNIIGGGIFWERNTLVRLLPYPELIDRLFAKFLGEHHLTHQLFLNLSSKKLPSPQIPTGAPTPLNFFICPRCSSPALESKLDAAACKACGSKFPLHNGIFDFR